MLLLFTNYEHEKQVLPAQKWRWDRFQDPIPSEPESNSNKHSILLLIVHGWINGQSNEHSLPLSTTGHKVIAAVIQTNE